MNNDKNYLCTSNFNIKNKIKNYQKIMKIQIYEQIIK